MLNPTIRARALDGKDVGDLGERRWRVIVRKSVGFKRCFQAFSTRCPMILHAESCELCPIPSPLPGAQSRARLRRCGPEAGSECDVGIIRGATHGLEHIDIATRVRKKPFILQ